MIIVVNVKSLNKPVKRQWMSKWIIKRDPTIVFLQEKNNYGERYIMLTLVKRKLKKLLISANTKFRTREFIKDKKRHYIIPKWSICQEDIAILNVYAEHYNTWGKICRATRRNKQIRSYKWKVSTSPRQELIYQTGRKSTWI